MVKLTEDPSDPVLSYINANFILNPYTGNQKEFIASQGSIEKSIENFWRIAWDEGVSTIVMLCGFQEYGRIACLIYWSDTE